MMAITMVRYLPQKKDDNVVVIGCDVKNASEGGTLKGHSAFVCRDKQVVKFVPNFCPDENITEKQETENSGLKSVRPVQPSKG